MTHQHIYHMILTIFRLLPRRPAYLGILYNIVTSPSSSIAFRRIFVSPLLSTTSTDITIYLIRTATISVHTSWDGSSVQMGEDSKECIWVSHSPNSALGPSSIWADNHCSECGQYFSLTHHICTILLISFIWTFFFYLNLFPVPQSISFTLNLSSYLNLFLLPWSFSVYLNLFLLP